MPTDNKAVVHGLLVALDKIASVASDPEQVKQAVADAKRSVEQWRDQSGGNQPEHNPPAQPPQQRQTMPG